MVHGKSFTVATSGFSDIKNITSEVSAIVTQSGVTDGVVAVSAVGSTASVTTIEFDPALLEDLRELLEKIVPLCMPSRHSATWGDDNGFSHLRATLIGPGITIPLSGGRMVLGTWQQIVLIDHDNRPRSRKVFVQVIGEAKNVRNVRGGRQTTESSEPIGEGEL